MKKIYIQLLFVYSLICSSLAGNAQVLTKVQQTFDAYQKERYQEKVFVHTDKDTYLAGELIWYKVYCRNSDFLLADFSKVIYVDVLDDHDNFVMQAKVALDKGSGSGSFYIPKIIKSGAFKLRAYTNWLKNFGTDCFFEKKLRFINLRNEQPEVSKKTEAYDIQFFPEGGSLVDGLTSKVAFKILGRDGRGIDLNGVIINEKNDTVARFSSLKFGIGSFLIKPSEGHTYKAIAKSLQQEIIIKELPKTKRNGYVLNVGQSGNDVSIKIQTNLSVANAFLVVHNNHQLFIAEQVRFDAGEAKMNLTLAQLKDGISSFTLFNSDGIPVAERLFFKRPSKQVVLTATPDKSNYPNRGKVGVNIDVKDGKGIPQRGDFSLAVYKLDSLNTLPHEEIVSYLWLSSVLKGNIESPAYYLTNDNPGANETLDNLLLSQGWRNFKWDEALTGQKPVLKFLPELNGHLVSGRAINSNGVVEGKGLYLGIPGKSPQFYATKLNANGDFLINTKKFYGSREMVLLPSSEADSLLKIKILSPFSEQFSKSKFNFEPLTSANLNALKRRSLGVETQNEYLSNKLKVLLSPNVDSTSFYGTPSKMYDLDLYTRFPTMEEVFREFIAEVRMTKHQKRSHLKILGNLELLNEDPLVILDGVPYNNIDMVMAFDPLKIKKLSVVKERYFYGGLAMEGILEFSTLNGDLGGQKIDPYALVIDYEGLALQREFYEPVYEAETQVKSRIPDFRDLLYWTPDLILDAQGKSKANFYTGDQSGNYIGVIQGISDNGIPASKYFTFTVK